MTDHPVQSAEHALITGMVLMTLMKGGLMVEPDMDDDGNYLASMVLSLPDPALGVRVRLVVEPMEEKER